MAKEKDKSRHYVDNKSFYAALVEYRKKRLDAIEAGLPIPRIPEYIGVCIFKIATKLSSKGNFVNYSYKEEMISDGIENCLLYAYNFDPTKSKNPFSYFTQIIYYAFLRRIQKEKKQAYIKLKKIEMSDVDSSMKKWFRENFLKIGDNFETLPTFLTENDINSFEKKTGEAEASEEKPKKASKKPVKKPAKKGKKK
jgi:hypothetical protein